MGCANCGTTDSQTSTPATGYVLYDNKYEEGRGNLGVWKVGKGGTDVVQVNLAPVVASGAQYRIVTLGKSFPDGPWGVAVASGTYNGGTVGVPVSGDHGMYLVLPASYGGGEPPPVPTATRTAVPPTEVATETRTATPTEEATPTRTPTAATSGEWTTQLTMAQAVAIAPVTFSGGAAGVITATANEQGAATWGLDAPAAADVILWVKVWSGSSGDDSWYVSANGANEDVFDAAEGQWNQNQFIWVKLNGRGGTSKPLTLNPRKLSLGEGNNTIKFRAREDGSKIQAMYATTDPAFVPGP